MELNYYEFSTLCPGNMLERRNTEQCEKGNPSCENCIAQRHASYMQKLSFSQDQNQMRLSSSDPRDIVGKRVATREERATIYDALNEEIAGNYQ